MNGAWRPIRNLATSLRFTGRGRKGVERAPHWARARPGIVVLRILTYAGAALLVLLVVRSLLVVIDQHGPKDMPFGFDPDEGCSTIGYSCGVANNVAMTFLTLAFAASLFFFYRLGRVRRPYVRRAKNDTADVVPTAGAIIGDVVGRDEVCHVIMDDLKVRGSRRPHVVVGGVGAGKTAVLFQLTHLLAAHGAVPVAIRLRDVERDLDFETQARNRFVRQVASTSLSDAEAEKVWRELRKDDQIVVLADGLEEAFSGTADRAPDGDDGGDPEGDNKIRNAIRDAHRQHLPLVVASRPHNALVGLDAALVELEPLGEEAALEYIESGAATVDEHRLDWVIETAEVTETPFYLQIAHELHAKGLLERARVRAQEMQLETRDVDRASLRVGLLRTWTEGLISGRFMPEIPMLKALRSATVMQLGALACVGLRRHDTLEVKFADLLRTRGDDPRKRGDDYVYAKLLNQCRAAVVTARLAADERASEEELMLDMDREVHLAATRAVQLRLAEPRRAGVRFPHSLMQAYLASRVIGTVLEDDPEFLEDALKNPSRELLLALVMHSRSRLRAEEEPASFSQITNALCDAIGDQSDLPVSVQLDIAAAALEIDSVDAHPVHEQLADRLTRFWPPGTDDRAMEETKLRVIARFGAAARGIADRAKKERGLEARPAYASLFAIAAADRHYRVRLAATQELGAGGDEVLDALEGAGLGPPDAQTDWRDEATHRQLVVRAWLSPMLCGSIDDKERYKAAKQVLGDWVAAAKRGSLPLSIESALAQGFKHAANRRPQHPHARRGARGYLSEQAADMLRHSTFWFTRLTLLQALCLWALPEANRSTGRRRGGRAGGRRRPDPAEALGRGADPRALVSHWLEPCPSDREHPFVAEARDLAILGLQRRQPERFLWIDESGVATRIGGRPARADAVRKHNLWIPPSVGWSALHPSAQRLVADVLLLLNLVERGDDPEQSERRLAKTAGPELPPCLSGERKYLQPSQTVGRETPLAPGASCKSECQFDLCPYPPKGPRPYRVELSEAFCRRQQVLLGRWWKPFPRRTASWQGATPGELRRFWALMEQRARR